MIGHTISHYGILEELHSIFGRDQQAYGRPAVGTNGLPALELFGENREPLLRAP